MTFKALSHDEINVDLRTMENLVESNRRGVYSEDHSNHFSPNRSLLNARIVAMAIYYLLVAITTRILSMASHEMALL